MNQILASIFVAVLLVCGVEAGPFGFGNGIGSAMYYGPYTGGHRYSYNTAYSYGMSFNSADSWRRDPVAYPAGIPSYHPQDRAMIMRAWTVQPPISTVSEASQDTSPASASRSYDLSRLSGTNSDVQPIIRDSAFIKIYAPDDAEVYVENKRFYGNTYYTPPLDGVMKIYSVRAKWSHGGKQVEQFRVVGVRGGETAVLTFGQ